MVEERLLHRSVERDRLELAETRRLPRLHDHQAPYGIRLEPADLDDRLELVCVEAVELAHVAVERADRHDGARIEPARGEHRRERVEIGVAVGCYDGFGPHGGILPRIRTADVAPRCPRASLVTIRQQAFGSGVRDRLDLDQRTAR